MKKKTDLLSKVFDTIVLCPNSTGVTVKDKCLTYLDGESNVDTEPSYYIKKDLEEIKTPTTLNTGLIYDLTELNKTYSDLVDAEINILTEFKQTILSLTSVFYKYIGPNGNIFDFLNCKFIGNNVNVILKYLSEAIGSNIYSVGVFLLVAGCSMIFSIIFTILEVIIINAAVDDKLKNPISGVSKFV